MNAAAAETTGPTCQRCAAPAAGLVAVSELDAGRAAQAVAEVPLCAACLAGVAVACGFDPPAVLRPGAAR